MKRFLLLVVIFVALGCGGGGSKSADQTIQFTTTPGQEATGNIETTTVVAPANAFVGVETVTVTKKSSVTNPPDNRRLLIDGPNLNIEATAEPNSPLIVSCDIDTRKTHRGVFIRDGKQWVPIPFVANGSRISFELGAPASRSVGSSRGLGTSWQIIVGWFDELVGNESLELARVAGTGTFGAGSILMIHGICDTKDSMTALGQRILTAQPQYLNVYSLGYDWKESTDSGEAVQFLADQLASVQAPKSVLVVAHSRGVLLGRYALEQLEATKAVSACIWLNGPNTGSRFGDSSDLLFGFISHIVNLTSGATQGLSIPSGDELSLFELVWDSSFTQELNQDNQLQRGNVDYFLVNSSNDLLVSQESAWAEGTNIEALTEGKVQRLTISGSHSDALHDTTVMDDLINQVFPTSSPGLEISSTPNPNPANWDGWDQTVVITNNIGETVELFDISIDQYNRDGYWWIRQWYVPGWLGSLPFDYHSFSETLGVGGSYQFSTHTGNGEDMSTWDPIWQAQTGIYTARVRGLSSGKVYDARVEIVRYSSYGWPSSAQTR